MIKFIKNYVFEAFLSLCETIIQTLFCVIYLFFEDDEEMDFNPVMFVILVILLNIKIFVIFNNYLFANVNLDKFNVILYYDDMSFIYKMTCIINLIIYFPLSNLRFNFLGIIKCAIVPASMCVMLKMIELNLYIGIIIVLFITYQTVKIYLRAYSYKARNIKYKRRAKVNLYLKAAQTIYAKIIKIFTVITIGVLSFTYITSFNNVKYSSCGLDNIEISEKNSLWKNNKDKFEVFLKYDDLSDDEKINALQSLCNYEAAYLGCEPVQISITTLKRECLGRYINDENKIELSEELLDMELKDSINTVLHEIFHVYEYKCVEKIDLDTADTDLYMYYQVEQWKNEFDNYISGSIDFASYYNQNCEHASRAYAGERTNWFIQQIESFQEK